MTYCYNIGRVSNDKKKSIEQIVVEIEINDQLCKYNVI